MSFHESVALMFDSIAEELSAKMGDLVKHLCFGCQVDHPSQRNHDLCLMADDEERFVRTFDASWDLVDIKGLAEKHIKEAVRAKLLIGE